MIYGVNRIICHKEYFVYADLFGCSGIDLYELQNNYLPVIISNINA